MHEEKLAHLVAEASTAILRDARQEKDLGAAPASGLPLVSGTGPERAQGRARETLHRIVAYLG